MHMGMGSERLETRFKDPIGIIHLDIPTMEQIRVKHGVESVERIVKMIDLRVSTLRSLSECGVIEHEMIANSTFVLVEFPLGHGYLSTSLYDAATTLQSMLASEIVQQMPILADLIELRFGTGIVRPQPERSFRDSYYDALVEAIIQTNRYNETSHRARRAEFMDIVQNRRIESVYQPIVSLWTGDAYGYEALSRGPANSPFASPLVLFEFAEEEGQLHVLEEVALEKAMVHFQTDLRNAKLFLNINSSMFTEQDFVVDRLISVFEGRDLQPYNIVLEISERRSIQDFHQFNRILNQYRSMGYLIAIDDAGAGYSSLQTIAEIKPDFIKIDQSLVRGIHTDKIREKMVEALCQAALACDCKVIAEGIETEEELTRIVQLGVPYAQGYFLGRPHRVIQPLAPSIEDALHISTTSTRPQNSIMVVGDIAKPVTTFTPDVEAREIVTYFHRNEHETGIVITEDNRPVGLVMREKLFRRLATKYGVSLFWNRPISQVMDRHPLILDKSVSVENSSVLSMGRHAEQLYDLIIVTTEGRLHGGLTIQMVLNALTNWQMELARDANPLTGLPGNRRIEVEISKRLSSSQSFSVIYVDLDHFKWFNDAFGFQKGDQAIRTLAEALRRTIAQRSERETFLGHIGGDDFIVVTTDHGTVNLAHSMMDNFTTDIVRDLPTPSDSAWTVRNREGQVLQVSGLTISLAVLRCEPPFVGLTHDSLSACAGELKRQAKMGGGGQVKYGDYAQMSDLYAAEGD